MANLDQSEPSLQKQLPVDALQSCQVHATLVDDDLFGPTIVLDYASEEAVGGRRIAVLEKHEIKGLAEFVDSTVEIDPLAFDLNIGLIHSPGAAGRGFAAMSLVGNKRRLFHDPSVQRRVVNGNAALGHDFFQITIRHGVSDVEKHSV